MSNRLTAMDVEKQTFRTRLKGFDPEEVRLYLKSVAEEIERLNLSNAELRENAAHLEERVEDFRTREQTLQQTMVTAQKMADELREKTEMQAELMVKEARVKAERLLEQAQDQLARIESEIGRAKLERDMFENRVRSVIEEHLAMLELRKKERADWENLRFLRRRSGSDAG